MVQPTAGLKNVVRKSDIKQVIVSFSPNELIDWILDRIEYNRLENLLLHGLRPLITESL